MSLEFKVAHWLTSFSYKARIFKVGEVYTAASQEEFKELTSQKDEFGRPYLVTNLKTAEAEKPTKAETEETPVVKTGKPFVLEGGAGKDTGENAGKTEGSVTGEAGDADGGDKTAEKTDAKTPAAPKASAKNAVKV